MAELYGRAWTRVELLRLLGDAAQVAGVCPVTLNEGPEAGARALQFRTGVLSFTVLADRCMDIGQVEVGGIPLAFVSPVGHVHPAYFDPTGAEWRRTFGGGLLTTGGLDTAGAPSTDQAAELGLHGRATSLAARGLTYDADWEGDEYVLHARARLRQVAFGGEHLQLTREISARLGESRFTIHDTVENLGTRPEPHVMLYHFNIGFPLLAEGTVLSVRTSRSESLDGKTRGPRAGRLVAGPAPEAGQEIIGHEAEAGADGRVTVAVLNRAFRGGQGLALAIRYAKPELPYLWQWRCFVDRSYVMGIEPSNGDIQGRARTRQDRRLVVLEPGDRRTYHLEVEAVTTRASVARLAADAGE